MNLGEVLAFASVPVVLLLAFVLSRRDRVKVQGNCHLLTCQYYWFCGEGKNNCLTRKMEG